MKTPKWESSPGATLALLATRQAVFADLYTITPSFSSVSPIYMTTTDYDVLVSGRTYLHGGPIVDQRPDRGTRAVANWKIGTDTDTWSVVLQPRAYDPATGAADPDTINGLSWMQAARAGLLDGSIW